MERSIDIGFKKYKNPIPSFYSYQSLPLDLEISPLFLIEGSGPTTMRVRGQGGMWPFHQVMLNGEPLPTSFVSKDELKAIISPEAIPTAGTYIVTLKCEGEAFSGVPSGPPRGRLQAVATLAQDKSHVGSQSSSVIHQYGRSSELANRFHEKIFAACAERLG